jgi:hypothetical protein
VLLVLAETASADRGGLTVAPVRGQRYPAMAVSAQRRTEAQRQEVRAALLAAPWSSTVSVMAAGHSPSTVGAVRRAMIAAHELHRYRQSSRPGGRARHSDTCWCMGVPLQPCPSGVDVAGVVHAFIRQRVRVQDACERRAREILGRDADQGHVLDGAAMVWSGWLPSPAPRRRVGARAPGGSEHGSGVPRIAAGATDARHG